MDGVPPIPATSVSLFVGILMLLTGLTVVLAMSVVRRRHRTLVTLAVALVTLLVLAAGGLFLIIPPEVPSAGSQRLASCPYDRLVWSNMREDVDESWQPCRRIARVQLAMTLVGASLVTVMAAAIAVRKPHADAEPELRPAATVGR